MPPRRRPAQAADPPAEPPAAADPDTALIHVRQAEAVLRAAERRNADIRAKANAMVAASDAEVEAAQADLEAARTAALAAARAARRAGRTLAQVTHPTALPADILLYIASMLPQRDVCSMADTCLAWRQALLASPSPIFRSVRFDITDLLKGSTELPLLAKLKNRAPDVMQLTFSGPKIKREHAWAASLVASFTRLTSLSYQTRAKRGDWIGLPLAAAGSSCPGLVSVSVQAMATRPPSPADIFPSLGAALGRVTRIAFETDWEAVLDAGREQRGTPWLEPATALRELHWEASAVPVLPATLALRNLKLVHCVRSVPPAALTPGLRSVRHVAMYLNEDAVIDAVLRGATRLTRFETAAGYYQKPMSPLVANLSTLRDLSWALSTPEITPAAALPALSALRLCFCGSSTITVAPGTLDAFTALRTLHINVSGLTSSTSLIMPALGPNFAPRLATLTLKHVTFDLATVAMTWEAESLCNWTLEYVKLTVDSGNVPDNVEPGGALGAEREAAVTAAAAADRAESDLRETTRRVNALDVQADAVDANGEPVFATEEENAAYRATMEAYTAAADAMDKTRAAKEAADRRVTECASEAVARLLPAALPAVSRVSLNYVTTIQSATAAVDALRALNGRRAVGGARRAGG